MTKRVSRSSAALAASSFPEPTDTLAPPLPPSLDPASARRSSSDPKEPKRKRLRSAAPTANTCAFARLVQDPDVCRAVFDLLDGKDLVGLMRTSKTMSREVMGYVYEEVDYKVVRTKLEKASVRFFYRHI